MIYESHGPFFINGDKLKESISNKVRQRSPLIEEILYEDTATMFFGGAGIGKTTLLAQIMAESSCGRKVFSKFNVPKPLVWAYMSFERPLVEIEERLFLMNVSVPYDTNNLHLTDKTIGIDLLRDKNSEFLLNNLKSLKPVPNIIVFDPIYASVRGGLSMDEQASVFTRFCSMVRREMECSLLLIHHTVKYTHEWVKKQKIQKDEVFYGSMWLKAHVTGSYYIEPSDKGTAWTIHKDNYRCLAKEFSLSYDPATHLSYIEDEPEIPKTEMFRYYFNNCLKKNKKFTIREIQTFVGISDRYARELLSLPAVKSSLEVHKSDNKSFEYEPREALRGGYELEVSS